MLKLRKIAITGSLATGKSTVSKYFQRLGAYIVNVDNVTHALLRKNDCISKKILSLFGNKVLTRGKISRKKLASIVFEDRNKLLQLEKIIHPKVIEVIEKEYEKVDREKSYKLFIVEMPLLYEIGLEDKFDKIILIKSTKENCLKRTEKRDIDKDQYNKRMQRLIPASKKVKKADFVIENDASLKELKQKIKDIYDVLTK
jgi:dephospho-CoA kinase